MLNQSDNDSSSGSKMQQLRREKALLSLSRRFSNNDKSNISSHLLKALIVSCLASFAIEQVFTLNPVLDINGTFPYLINKTSGHIIEPRNYMDFDNIYTPNEAYRSQQTAQGKNYHLIKAFDFANYFQSDYWHYSSEQDLKLSAYPVANPTKCAIHLNWIETQLNNSGILFKSGEQHVNLMNYVDSFGKQESTTYLGRSYWLGSYYECIRTSINMAKFEQEECKLSQNNQSLACTSASYSLAAADLEEIEENADVRLSSKVIKTRYCIGKAHDIDWPSEQKDNYIPRISIKVGLCLPETCETLSISRHRAQIERLMRFSLPDYLKSRTNLHDMYCLPDPRSPIRALSLSGHIYVTICLAWLAILLAATSVYSCYKRNQRDLKNIMMAEQVQRELEISQRQLDSKLKNELLDNNNMVTIDLNEVSKDRSTKSSSFLNYMTNNNNNNNNSYIDDQEMKSGTKSMLASGAQLLMLKTQVSLANISPVGQANTATGGNMTTTATTAPLTDGVTGIGDSNNNTMSATNQLQPLRLHDSESDVQSRSSLSHRSSSSSLSNWLNGRLLTLRILQAMSIKENMREFNQPPPMLREPGAADRLRINLNALDSIKCLCCVLVILGHIVFIHMQHLSNIIHTIELSYQVYPRLLIAFFNFVDTFFIISGMLTAYFIFKRFNKETFGKPLIWMYISLLRLLRLSPVYLLVFWFVKSVAVHVSDGPIWDYGTDRNSIKGLCINDHWWKSLLYLGNVGTMQPNCILPAWSIIVDSQYSLIMPPILFLILKHKKLGYLSLLIAVIISTTNMSLQLATQTAVKTSDMAKIRLHVYPLISRFAAEFYNTAWNRIGPVAIGILGGHMLYLYDIAAIRQWPWFMRGVSFKLVLFMHLFIFIMPTIGRFTDDPESASTSGDTNMTIFILSNATIKPVWSLINTIFLLRLVTDLRTSSVIARIMSHNIWHCLGKLCFTSYLIHYEVVLTLLKSNQVGLAAPSWINVMREFSVAFMISTILSYFIYILFEAPINRLVTLTMAKPKSKC